MGDGGQVGGLEQGAGRESPKIIGFSFMKHMFEAGSRNTFSLWLSSSSYNLVEAAMPCGHSPDRVSKKTKNRKGALMCFWQIPSKIIIIHLRSG